MKRFTLGAILFVIAWCIIFSIDAEYERSTPLGGGVTLVEKVHVYRQPYLGMAEAGGSFWLPIPYRGEAVVGQRLVRNGAALWESPKYKTFIGSVSPNNQFVMLRSRMHDEWWRIYDLTTGKYVDVWQPAERPGMPDYMYSFKFGRWSEDSRFIYAAIEGTELVAKDDWQRYREIWTVDASDASVRRIHHCNQPQVKDPTWGGTECAGQYEH